MIDRYKLDYEIKRNGYKIDDFCKDIGLSRSAFYRKSHGKSEFTQSEMQKILDTLHLESPVGIFFA